MTGRAGQARQGPPNLDQGAPTITHPTLPEGVAAMGQPAGALHRLP